jgi:Ca2+-binding RTX toxin-like protein
MTSIVDLSQWSYLLSPNQYDLQVGGSDYYVENADRTYSLTSPSSNVARFQVDGGDFWSGDTTNRNRSEISGLTHYAPGTQVDVSYGFMIEPGTTNSASWLVTGQFHQVENNGYSPPFEINFNGGDHMGIAVNYLTSTGAQAYKQLWTDSSNIVRGHNYQMQIQATFDQGTGSGHLVVIRDGVTLVNYTGPMGFPGMSGVYWKEGVYRSANSQTMAIDYSNLSVTTGTSSPPTSDTVYSSTSYSLAGLTAHNLILTGTAGITGTANNLGDHLTANSGDDTLISGTGIDTLTGGTGNDTFYVHNSADKVVVGATHGADVIISTVSYALPANVSALRLSGTGLTATGNAAGHNYLTSINGGDTLIGGAGGNDVFAVSHSNDKIVVAAGTANETVKAWSSFSLPANVQNLTGEGSAAITLVGNSMSNVITANSGHDTLTGGGGADTFVMTPGQAAETVTDFSAASGDKVDISGYLAKGLHPTFTDYGTYSTAHFSTGETITLLGVHANTLSVSGHYIV